MARRLFFVEEVHSGRAEIVGDEALHLSKVLRVEPGQRYEISDNQRLFLAEVEVARKGQVTFRVVEDLPVRQPPVQMVLLPALIKVDHFEWTLEKATELGVDRIVPVIATRTEKGLENAARHRHERWRRILRESSQQSRRWRMPELEPVRKFEKALEAPGWRCVLDESESARPMLNAIPEQRSPDDTVCLLVGPEGGWTEVERQQATNAGWTAVSLGPSILRAETAACAGLAIIAAAWHVTADVK